MSFNLPTNAKVAHPGPPPSAGLFNPSQCEHVSRRFVWRVVSGVRLYGDQCLTCGRAVPQTFFGAKRAGEIHQIPLCESVPYDDEFTKAKEVERAFSYDAIRLAEKKWGEWYAAYMQSEAWADKRAKVLDRDNGLCRFCECAADQVHHLTYKRAGYEDLNDLVAVCRACHEGIHSRRGL